MRLRRTSCQGALVALLIAATAGSAAAQMGRVSGFVKDERGEPVKGATVTAENPDAIPSSFTSTTDDKGRFGMIGLRSGPWTIRAQAPGFSGQTGEVNVRQSSVSAPVTFVLQKVIAPPSALGGMAAKDIQTALGAADQLYNNLEWDAAITAYREILKDAPALSAINLQIAAAYRNKGDFNGALAAYRALLSIDPGNDKAKLGIAMTNLQKGDLQAAEQTLEVAAQSSGATREVFYNLGEVKLSKNRIDEATKAYEAAVKTDPSWGKPVFALGRMAMNIGDKDGAVKYFERVVEIDPASPEAAQARTALEQIRK